MKESRLEKLAPLSGLVTVVLFIIAAALTTTTLEYLPPAEEIADNFSANSTRISVGAYLGTLSAFFLIWFAGSVRNTLHEREGGTGRLSVIAFGGGVASAVLVAISFSLTMVIAVRANAVGGIEAIGAITLYDLAGQIMGITFPVTMAVLLAATAVVSLRADLFPAWFSWLTALIAFGLLTPISYILLLPAVLWVLVVSIWLYVKGRSPAE
jgi:hypothetical protein